LDITRRAAIAATTAMAASAMGLAKSWAAPDGPDLVGLAEMVRRREASPGELLDEAIARAEALNPRLNFLTQRHYDYARQAIARGLPDGPFSGVPWLLKDLNTFLAGEVTGQGSRYYAGNRPTVTSELVRRYERAGLVIFGKTASPEFGLTPTTESKANGRTRNPWNPERTAGGSSGGAASAVAAGVLPAAHATDGGGSIRIPASCCGLFGLKPSRGRMPMGPARTEGWGGMSTPHVVSWSVRDSAALLDATHGLEPGSRYGAPTPERPFLQDVGRPPGNLRIALNVVSPSGSPVDPECAEAARQAARLCESLGHQVTEAAPKLDAAAIGRASSVIVRASVASDLRAREAATGVKPSPDVLEAMTWSMLEQGEKLTAMEFVRANEALQQAAVQVALFMADYDVILSPTLGQPPIPLGVLDPSPADFKAWYEAVQRFSPFTALQNQTGQPSMSVPLAMSKAGLPIGVMFSGRYGDEGLLFRLAGQLEQAAPWKGRRPRL
jgi:amidase